MDSQSRDEARTRWREEALARRVGEALDQLNPRDANDCPDAEVIAAYHERSLPAEETARWESHFATCARCRKILLVLAASSDAPLSDKEVARLGELASAGRVAGEKSAAPARTARANIWDWRRRWLAPALGAAAVLIVWVALRVPWRAVQRGTSETLIAQAPKTETRSGPGTPGAAPEFSKATPEALQTQKGAESAPQRERSQVDLRSENAPAKPPAKRQFDERSRLPNPSAGANESSIEEKKAQAANSAGGELDALASSPRRAYAPAAAPGAKQQDLAQAQTPAPARPEPPSSAVQTPTVTGAAPVVGAANAVTGAPAANAKKSDDQVAETSAATNGSRADKAVQESPKALPSNGASFQALSRVNGLAGTALLLKAPSGPVVWRAGRGGAIERSADGGQTWTSQASPRRDDWLAGAAVSDVVCWLAGRNGGIARTLDGDRWERIAPPAQAAGADGKLPDWVAIVAQGANSAVVTSTDGRRFSTQDAGKNWQPQ